MSKKTSPQWLLWAQEIQALAQTGAHYAENEFQRERNQRLGEIAAEIVSEHTSLEKGPVLEVYNRQTGYATPRVDVRGAVFEGNKLLLVRERMDGGWTMPGGWVDVGNLPSEAAEREVREESGFEVKAQRVIGIYDANRVEPMELFHAFKIVFLCDIIGGQARPSNETTEVGFFGPDDIPEILSGERTQPRQIQDAFAARADKGWKTRFD
jgi:ADP-ribose pyrophosphatase YjhB (NUDIX family)